jgi:hypothetical protein
MTPDPSLFPPRQHSVAGVVSLMDTRFSTAARGALRRFSPLAMPLPFCRKANVFRITMDSILVY